jgi:hypothetical protein
MKFCFKKIVICKADTKNRNNSQVVKVLSHQARFAQDALIATTLTLLIRVTLHLVVIEKGWTSLALPQDIVGSIYLINKIVV